MKSCVHIAVIMLFLFGTVSSSGILKCPRHTIMDNFNITRFTGHWYEIERAFYIMELTVKCLSIDIERNKRGQIQVTARSRSRWSSNKKISEGIAIPTRRDSSIVQYKVASNLPNVLARLLPGVGTYQILDTDYDNYAIIWSCISYGLIHGDRVWIWGRQQEIDVHTRAKIYNFLTNERIDPERLIISSTNCTD